jgi:hypothetical protein
VNEVGCGRAFTNFTESRINFAPTYKYRVGTNLYSFQKPPAIEQDGLATGGEKKGNKLKDMFRVTSYLLFIVR